MKKKNSSIATKRIIHRSDFFKISLFLSGFLSQVKSALLILLSLSSKTYNSSFPGSFFFFLTYLWCQRRYPATLRFVTPGYKSRIVFHIFRIQKHVNPWQFYNSQLYLSSHVIYIMWLLYECVKIQCVPSKKGKQQQQQQGSQGRGQCAFLYTFFPYKSDLFLERK